MYFTLQSQYSLEHVLLNLNLKTNIMIHLTHMIPILEDQLNAAFDDQQFMVMYDHVPDSSKTVIRARNSELVAALTIINRHQGYLMGRASLNEKV